MATGFTTFGYDVINKALDDMIARTREEHVIYFIGSTIRLTNWSSTSVLEAIPAGTVVKDPLGKMRVRSAAGLPSIWTDKEISPLGDYVVQIAGVVDPEHDETQKLAKELNLNFYGTLPPSWYDPTDKWTSPWYDLAIWVNENFTRKPEPTPMPWDW